MVRRVGLEPGGGLGQVADAGRVGMEAPGLDGEGNLRAGGGAHGSGGEPFPEARGDGGGVFEDGTGLVARDEGAVRVVGAVEEALREEWHGVGMAGGLDVAAREAHGGDPGEADGDPLDEGVGGVRVGFGVVIEGAVELDVGQARGARDRVEEGGQPGDLFVHESGQFPGREVDGAATEVAGLARVGAEVEVVGAGESDQAAHGVGVTGVAAAGDVDAVHLGAEFRGEPGWFAFAEVAIEVEHRHGFPEGGPLIRGQSHPAGRNSTGRPAGVWARRQRSRASTQPILGYPPTVGPSGRVTMGRPSGGTWMEPGRTGSDRSGDVGAGMGVPSRRYPTRSDLGLTRQMLRNRPRRASSEKSSDWGPGQTRMALVERPGMRAGSVRRARVASPRSGAGWRPAMVWPATGTAPSPARALVAALPRKRGARRPPRRAR